MKRLVLSTVIVVIWAVSAWLYGLIQGPLESGVAAKQVEDSALSFALAKGVPGLVPRLMFGGMVVVLLIVWLPPLWKWLRATPKKEE